LQVVATVKLVAKEFRVVAMFETKTKECLGK